MSQKLAIRAGLKGIKEGDKLVCKKTFQSRFGHIFYAEGKIYEITYIKAVQTDRILVEPETMGGLYKIGIAIIGEKNCLDFFNFFFDEFEYYIWEYFYTEKEIRKEKLKKLGSGL